MTGLPMLDPAVHADYANAEIVYCILLFPLGYCLS